MKACGSDLTRACVMDHASATEGWTAGGLHVPTNPSNTSGTNSECFIALQPTLDGFIINDDFTKPNTGLFNCDPANAVALPGFEQ